MCGIFGAIKNNKTNSEVYFDSLNKLSHRGPDEDGFFNDENIFLAGKFIGQEFGRFLCRIDF